MKPKTRLILIALMILGSAFYGALISTSPRVASAIMLGYIGVILTLFFTVEVWKKP